MKEKIGIKVQFKLMEYNEKSRVYGSAFFLLYVLSFIFYQLPSGFVVSIMSEMSHMNLSAGSGFLGLYFL